MLFCSFVVYICRRDCLRVSEQLISLDIEFNVVKKKKEKKKKNYFIPFS